MKIKYLATAVLLLNGCWNGSGTVSPALDEGGGKESLLSLRKKVNKAPADALVRCSLGMALKNAGRPEEALTQFDSALVLQPSLLQAKYGRADAKYLSGDPSQGLTGFLGILQEVAAEPYVSEIASRVGCPFATRQLTTGLGESLMPRYSFSGSEITYQSNRDGNWEIYRMMADGSSPVRLTFDTADDQAPSYSPDGRLIVFTSTRLSHADKNGMRLRDIFVMNSRDGSEVQCLVRSPQDEWAPTYSSKDQLIAFVSDRDDPREGDYGVKQSDIFLYSTAHSTISRFTQGFGDKSSPGFAPAGEALVYINNVNGDFEIYEQALHEANGHRLVADTGQKGGPHFSPSGRQLLYFEKREGNFDLFQYDMDKKSVQRLTCDPALEAFGCYSPTGDRILFCSNRSGSYQIFEMNLKSPVTRAELSERISGMLAKMEQASN